MTPRTSDTHHEPVLVDEVVRLLVTNPGGAIIDLTAGSGGHLRAMAGAMDPGGRLYGVDRDAQAVGRTAENLKGCPQLKKVVHAAYGDLAAVVGDLEDKEFDGIFVDLGLSSNQLDDAGRGFSFRLDGPLDMRFDPESTKRNAADLVNSLSAKQLTEILRDFGEEKRAARIAEAIVRERQENMILTTAALAKIITGVTSPQYVTKTLSRCFQGLRLAVNGELDQLKALLPIMLSYLKVGGRVGIIAYHSLEDRLVKRYFQREAKDCLCPPGLPACVCNHKAQLKIITRRVVKVDERERRANPRSRSARLRVAERLPS